MWNLNQGSCNSDILSEDSYIYILNVDGEWRLWWYRVYAQVNLKLYCSHGQQSAILIWREWTIYQTLYTINHKCSDVVLCTNWIRSNYKCVLSGFITKQYWPGHDLFEKIRIFDVFSSMFSLFIYKFIHMVGLQTDYINWSKNTLTPT